MDHGFEKKYKCSRHVFIFLLGIFFYFLLVTVLNRQSHFEGLRGLGYGLVLFIYGILALNGNKTEFLIFSLVWVMIALISAYIMFGLLGIITGDGIDILLEKSGDLRTYSALAAGALKFSLGRIVLALYKKKRKMAAMMEDWIMAGTFLLLFILVLGMFCMEAGNLSQTIRYCISLGVLGGMFGLVVLLSMFYWILDKYRREKMEMEYQDECQKLQKEQIHNLYQIGREANRMRHDMKVKLDIIYGLLMREGYEEAKMCVKKMGAEWDQYSELPRDTGNEGLNAALMKAMKKCKEKNIKFHYVVLGCPREIESMDMGNLTDNLLRNGIEACEGLDGKGEVEIVIRKENGIVEIEVENTVKESVLKTNPRLKSTKKEKFKHGFGMKSIQKIVESYQGDYFCKEEEIDGEVWFVQNIYLKIKEKGREEIVNLESGE